MTIELPLFGELDSDESQKAKSELKHAKYFLSRASHRSLTHCLLISPDLAAMSEWTVGL